MTEMHTTIFSTTIIMFLNNNCIVTLEKSDNIYIFIINKMIGFITTMVTSITIDNAFDKTMKKPISIAMGFVKRLPI